MSEVSWSFSFVWNRSLEQREERKLKPRQHVWASELGGAMIDRYLKMNAVEPSNPFDSRSLRKFEAGRVFEWIVEMVLTRAGILISKQDWVDFQYPGLLKVTGKMDHLAGGKPDYEKARSQVETEFLPEFIKRASLAVVNYFAGEYPNGLKPIAMIPERLPIPSTPYSFIIILRGLGFQRVTLSMFLRTTSVWLRLGFLPDRWRMLTKRTSKP